MKMYHGILISGVLHSLILLVPIPREEVSLPAPKGMQVVDILTLEGDGPAAGEEPAPVSSESPERQVSARDRGASVSEPARGNDIRAVGGVIEVAASVTRDDRDRSPHSVVPLEIGIEDSEHSEPAERGLLRGDSAAGRGGGSSGDTLVTTFGVDGGPRFRERRVPSYPRKAKDLEREGVVVLALELDELGRLTAVDVVKEGGFGFDEEAVRAVKESSFLPATRNGRPVACRAILPIRFVLR